jgi:type IV pilus assembly protein PilQ
MVGAVALAFGAVIAHAQSAVDPVLQPRPHAKRYTGEKISLNFQSIDIRLVFQVIADFADVNIVTSDSVSGVLNLRMKEVPWDQALDVILDSKNLDVRRNGSVLWIAPKGDISAKERSEFEERQQLENLEPVETQAFQLNYAKAVTIAQGLAGPSSSPGRGASVVTGSSAAGDSREGIVTAGRPTSRILSARGSVLAEARTNQLFVTDVPARLAQVSALVRKLDIPVRQVLIEARIVEALDSFGKSLGVKLGGGIINNRGTIGASSTATGFTDSNFVNLPSSGVLGNGAAPGAFAFSLFNAGLSRVLDLEISALEADHKGKVVASPSVVTADQTKALIEQGTELPYQVATSSGATSIAFRKANLKLEVTPQITPDGDVILALDVNKDMVGRETAAGFAVNTKHVQTEVLVQDGGTVVIGGIFEVTETNDESRIPVLGEMPVIGGLFRTRSRSTEKMEMLVFITPKVQPGAMALEPGIEGARSR